jgi:hypothetical protein
MLFKIENLVFRARSEFDDFAGKDCEVFWGTGVLEYWSVGKSESPNFRLNGSFHYSITPPLQQTCRKGERPLRPPQGVAQSRVLRARILYLDVVLSFCAARFLSDHRRIAPTTPPGSS